MTQAPAAAEMQVWIGTPSPSVSPGGGRDVTVAQVAHGALAQRQHAAEADAHPAAGRHQHAGRLGGVEDRGGAVGLDVGAGAGEVDGAALAGDERGARNCSVSRGRPRSSWCAWSASSRPPGPHARSAGRAGRARASRGRRRRAPRAGRRSGRPAWITSAPSSRAGCPRCVARYDDVHGVLDVADLAELVPDLHERTTFACGPAGLLDALTALPRGLADPLHTERFRLTAW